VIALSSDWTSSFTTTSLTLTWALVLALTGGPLLRKYLNSHPVSRRELLHAAWNLVAKGCWITLGNCAVDAQKQGLISEPMTILIVAVLFGAFAGGAHLLERWYPETEP
jgi:hypothetical protein